MKQIWVLVLGILMIGSAQAHDEQWVLTSHDVVDVHDGDTFFVRLTGLPSVFGERLPIRVRGVDTPELRSSCATEKEKEAEKAMAKRVRDLVTARLMAADQIVISNFSRGSFFRVVADVSIDGVDLAQWLIEREYSYNLVGDQILRGYWCEPSHLR